MAYLTTVTRRFQWDDDTNRWEPCPGAKVTPAEVAILREFDPDRDGRSGWVDIELLKVKLPEFADRLGGNGSNMFTRMIAKDFLFSPDHAKQCKGTKVVARRSVGLVKAREESFPIRADIRKAVLASACVVLGTNAQLEVDHKDGRKDDPHANAVEHQRLEDFQAMHKSANGVKREKCKACKRTNLRFDARTLGYTCGWIEGGAAYEGTCRGCYYHDPRAFNAALYLPDP